MDKQSNGGGSGGGGVGEVRRIHIIYFLSRKGRIEHPHLIRVHHLSRNGVHLRDVKRWLSELRGKDMAESFAWSYKRKYKTGYVWQDLLDEDLITPISDNEYVIKGSEISSTITTDSINTGEANPHGENSSKVKNQEHPQDQSMQESMQKSTEIEQESPPCTSETSTVTDESTKNDEQEEKTSKSTKNNGQTDQPEKHSLYSTWLNKNKNKKIDGIENNNNNSNASKNEVKRNSKNYSTGASNVLRNIITCGAIDTNESAMVKIDRRDKISLSAYTSKIIASITPEIRKEEEHGGSKRISGNVYSNLQQQYQSGRKSWDGVKISRKKNNNSNSKNGEFTTSTTQFKTTSNAYTTTTAAAAFKPVNVPNCSQCGKSFKPEKLHQHMKSCKGLRAFSTKSPIPTTNILVKY